MKKYFLIVFWKAHHQLSDSGIKSRVFQKKIDVSLTCKMTSLMTYNKSHIKSLFLGFSVMFKLTSPHMHT